MEDALFAPEARAAYARLLKRGLADALRAGRPGGKIYTFWDLSATPRPQRRPAHRPPSAEAVAQEAISRRPGRHRGARWERSSGLRACMDRTVRQARTKGCTERSLRARGLAGQPALNGDDDCRRNALLPRRREYLMSSRVGSHLCVHRTAPALGSSGCQPEQCHFGGISLVRRMAGLVEFCPRPAGPLSTPPPSAEF